MVNSQVPSSRSSALMLAPFVADSLRLVSTGRLLGRLLDDLGSAARVQCCPFPVPPHRTAPPRTLSIGTNNTCGLPSRHPYSAECVEGVFSEVRFHGVLRSSFRTLRRPGDRVGKRAGASRIIRPLPGRAPLLPFSRPTGILFTEPGRTGAPRTSALRGSKKFMSRVLYETQQSPTGEKMGGKSLVTVQRARPGDMGTPGRANKRPGAGSLP